MSASFIIAIIVGIGVVITQLLIIMSEAQRPIPDKNPWQVFWPVFIGVPVIAIVIWSHWWSLSW